MKKIVSWQFFVLLFLSISIVACDDDDDAEPEDTTQQTNDEQGDEEENGEETNGEETEDGNGSDEITVEKLLGQWETEGEDMFCDGGVYEYAESGDYMLTCLGNTVTGSYTLTDDIITFSLPIEDDGDFQITSLTETQMEATYEGNTYTFVKIQ